MENFQKRLLNTVNIFDILIVLYQFVNTSNGPSYIKQYGENLNKGYFEAPLYQCLNQLIDELLDENISFDMFKEELANLCKEEPSPDFCIWILLYFDQILEEYERYPHLKQNRRLSLQRLTAVGPLNTSLDGYQLYYTPVKGIPYHSPVIRNIRSAQLRDTSKIASLLSSYHIISKPADEPYLIVKKYGTQEFKECFAGPDSTLKIAVVPFYKDTWYKTKLSETPIRNYFEILSESSLEETINTAYIRMLETLNQQNVDIVVFPELAMNASTKNVVCKWLAAQYFGNPAFKIKLIFLGSFWNYMDKTNTCTLLSSTGTVLLENHKKIGFIYKNPENRKQYHEALSQRPSYFEALDLDYLGRLIYFICRDSLEDLDQAYLWNQHHINIEVISSYSKSLSHFENKMRYFSQTHKGISVVANCCEPRSQKDTVGFISLPATDLSSENRNAEGFLLHHRPTGHCQNHCEICKCYEIFTLYPFKVENYAQYQTLKAERRFSQDHANISTCTFLAKTL